MAAIQFQSTWEHYRLREKLLFRVPMLISEFSLVHQALSCHLWLLFMRSSQPTT